MNIAVIFAGGVGKRMGSDQIPKQFLEAQGRPIIVHTLAHFQESPEVDLIVISCVAGWIDYMNRLVERYALTKVAQVVPGGETGQLSIWNGLQAAERYARGDDIVLIHDGVRPLISRELISRNIAEARTYGSCITCVPVIETIVQTADASAIDRVYERDPMMVAKAPQTFRLADILAAHRWALDRGVTNSIDSCTLMADYGAKLHMTRGDYKNIKITTPIDYAMFKAILEAESDDA